MSVALYLGGNQLSGEMAPRALERLRSKGPGGGRGPSYLGQYILVSLNMEETHPGKHP